MLFRKRNNANGCASAAGDTRDRTVFEHDPATGTRKTRPSPPPQGYHEEDRPLASTVAARGLVISSLTPVMKGLGASPGGWQSLSARSREWR